MKRALAVLGVLAVLVLVSAVPAHAGGGCHGRTNTEGTGSAVDLRMNCFKPSVLSVAPGTTVTFTNRDEVEHAISGTALEEWEAVAPGASTQQRYDTPGTYAYMCHLHPGMAGAIVVGEQALPTATQPIADTAADHDAGIALLPLAAALVVGLAGGVVISRRRVASPE